MRRKLASVILLMAALAACGKEETEEEDKPEKRVREENTKEEEEPETPEDPGVMGDTEEPVVDEPEVAYIPITVSYGDIYLNNDDLGIDPDGYKLYFSGYYPIIEMEGEDYRGMKYTLEQISKNVKSEVEQRAEDTKEWAADDGMFEEDNPDYYYYLECDTSIDRADTKVVCLCNSYNDFAGGVHPNYYFDAHCYDTATGNELKIFDVIDENHKHEFADMVEEKVFEEREELKDALFVEDLGDYVEEGNITYDLTREGVCVYFSPYEIAAYAAGATIVTIPYKELDGIIKAEYTYLPEGYVAKAGKEDYSESTTLSDGRTVAFLVNENNDEGTLETTITVDGKEYTFEEYAYGAEVFIAECGGKVYAYEEYQSDNDYRFVTAYDLNGPAPSVIDSYDGGFYHDVYDPENMVMSTTLQITSTYTGIRHYRIDKNGRLEPTEDSYMIKTYDPDYTVGFKCDVEAKMIYTDDPDTEYDSTIKAGTRLKPYATDGNSRFEYISKDGKTIYRLEVDTSDYPQKIGGKELEEVLEDIVFAG